MRAAGTRLRTLGGLAAVLGVAAFLPTLGACAKRESEAPSGSATYMSAEAPPPPPADQAARGSAQAPGTPAPAPAVSTAAPRKLVKTVDLELEVRATDPAAAEVQRLAARLGGYVAGVDARRHEGLMHYRLTLRVPVERLEEALAAVKSLAVRVDREQQKTEDVTDQYVDLDARLRTLRATEAELQALLAESRARQRKVDEIMAVYRELTEIRSQVEQIQGRLAGLERQVTYSTLNVELVPIAAARPVVSEGWRPSDTVRESVRKLIAMLRGLADFAIFAVIVLLPAALVPLLAILLLRWLWRRLRRPRS